WVCGVGSIGLVGVVMGDIWGKVVGVEYGVIMAMCSLVGGIVLVVGDVGCGIVNGAEEVGVGMMVGFVGVALFVYVGGKERRAV
ncbi:iron chelate uptake ABC transporter family permease subunit, partial [Paenibacillus xylanexedens]|uniref:iron chelate uptake ABC transporter family permease subunit n=1 Tax=Paenibacillus xylanexedens TaxID=528191 RepID=UPI0011A35C1C